MHFLTWLLGKLVSENFSHPPTQYGQLFPSPSFPRATVLRAVLDPRSLAAGMSLVASLMIYCFFSPKGHAILMKLTLQIVTVAFIRWPLI